MTSDMTPLGVAMNAELNKKSLFRRCFRPAEAVHFRSHDGSQYWPHPEGLNAALSLGIQARPDPPVSHRSVLPSGPHVLIWQAILSVP